MFCQSFYRFFQSITRFYQSFIRFNKVLQDSIKILRDAIKVYGILSKFYEILSKFYDILSKFYDILSKFYDIQFNQSLMGRIVNLWALLPGPLVESQPLELGSGAENKNRKKGHRRNPSAFLPEYTHSRPTPPQNQYSDAR